MVGPVTKPIDETLLYVCSAKRIGVSHLLGSCLRPIDTYLHTQLTVLLSRDMAEMQKEMGNNLLL